MLDLNVGFDCPLVPERGGLRHLIITLTAAAAPRTAPPSRPPLHLVLVLDASGSMTGPRLAMAKRCAIELIESLAPDVTLSLVAFDEAPRALGTRLSMAAAGKDEATRLVTRLHAGTSTDLHAGWAAATKLLAHPDAADPERRLVLLLSDGHANCGITDAGMLQEASATCLAQGIVTSTVGIGDDYSPVQLQALAAGGGGRMHDAETAQDLVDVLLGELDAHAEIAAEAIDVHVCSPTDLPLSVVGHSSVRQEPGSLIAKVGSLRCGASRSIILRIDSPPGQPGTERRFTVKATWRRPGEMARQTTSQHPALLLYAAAEACAAARDIARTLTVSRVWQSHIVQRAAHLKDEGDSATAQHMVRAALEEFRAYCNGLPEARPLIAELEHLLRSLREDWNPRMAKEIALSNYKSQACEPDLRSMKRPEWTSFLRRSDEKGS